MSTKVPFAGTNEELFRMGGKPLAELASGKGAGAKAAQQEIARRKANRAQKKAVAA